MKMTRLTTTLFLAAAIGIMGISPALAANKIGFVDLPKLLQDSPQRKAASERVEKEFNARKQEIETLLTKIQALEAEIKRNADTMSATQLKRKENELVDMQREAKRAEQYFKEDLSMRNNEELVALQNVIFKTIEKVAKKEGYDLVMAEGIAYYSDKINITDLVIEQLNKDYKSK